MVDQILKSVKRELGSKLVSLGLSETKANSAIKLAQETVQTSLTGQISAGGTDGLLSLFNGKPPLDQSSLVKSMIANCGSKLVTKLGVSETTSKSVSSFLITFIMSKVSNQVAGKDESTIVKLISSNSPMDKIKSLSGMFRSVLFF